MFATYFCNFRNVLAAILLFLIILSKAVNENVHAVHLWLLTDMARFQLYLKLFLVM